jgi:hypothetical protein
MVVVICVLGCASHGMPSPDPVPQAPLTEGTGRACRQGEIVSDGDTTFDSPIKAPSTFHPLSAPHLRYPARLRREGAEGIVRAAYTVDTVGHVIPGSERIIAEAHSEFGDAVCDILRELRFTPFVAHGRSYSVRILDQAFTFSLIR